MEDLITSYLVLSGECPLRGIGKLTISRSNAVCDLASKEILPPENSIQLMDHAFGNEEGLIQYISDSKNCSIEESKEALNLWLEDVKNKLDEGNTLDLSFLGKLGKQNDDYYLVGSDSLKLFRPVKAERVIHEQDSHQMIVGDRVSSSSEMNQLLHESAPEGDTNKYLINALILFLVTAALIALYSYTDFFDLRLLPQNPPETYIIR